MGWKYEVETYVILNRHDENYPPVECGYETVYTGESLIRAVLAMREAKKSSGCVRFSWR